MKHKRLESSSLDLIYEFAIPVYFSDSDLASLLCANLNLSVTILNTYPAYNNPNTYTLPSCFLTDSTSLRQLTLTSFKIPDLSQLPRELESLILKQITFTGATTSPSTSSPDGATPDNSGSPEVASAVIIDNLKQVNWDALFGRFPDLTSLSLAACSITGSLPDILPARISTFIMAGNALQGGISSNFFGNFADGTSSTFTINLSGTSVTGSFPSFGLVAPRTLDSLYMNLESCGLTGALPATPFALLTVRYSFIIDFAFNGLSGTIPATFFNGIGQPYIFSASLQSTRLSGQIPETLFAPLSQFASPTPAAFQDLPNIISSLNSNYSGASQFTFNAAYNSFNGSIPANLFAGIPAALIFSVTFELNSDIKGPLPADIFNNLAPGPSNSTTLGISASSFNFNLNYCNLNGTLPPSPFLTVGKATAFTFIVSRNDFVGDVPSNFFFGIDPVAVGTVRGNVLADMSDLLLNGTIPSILFPSLRVSNWLSGFTCTFQRTVNVPLIGLIGSLPENIWANVNSTGLVTLSVLGNHLSGTLPPNILPALRGTTTSQISIILSTNGGLNGTIPNSWTNLPLRTLALSGNSLSGTLPAGFFTYAPSILQNVDVSLNPLLGGSLPALPSVGITNFFFYLQNTSIDVCSVTSDTPSYTFPTRIQYCNMNGTNVCSVNDHCAQVYTRCNPYCGPITPSLPPATCPLSTRPSPDFLCVGLVWTAPSSVTIPTLVITSSGSGSTQAVINGNLTTSSVVYHGIGTTLVVTGCTTNLTQIHVELTQSETEILKTSPTAVPLLSSSTNCSQVDLSNVLITAKVRDSSCKRVTAKNSVSEDGSLLSAVFSINSSKCNTWWIILVSVLCGAVALAVVIFVVLVLTVPAVRSAVRPYSKASRNRAARNTSEMNSI